MELSHLKEQNQITSIAIEDIRRSNVLELMSILPLNISPQNNTVIFLTTSLPVHGLYKADNGDIPSASMGYLVLFLQLLSYILDISLPYHMKFLGSKSLIWDPTNKSDVKYPLIFDGKQNETQKALARLNGNIFYLCVFNGLVFEDGINAEQYHFLNLYHLINSPNLFSRIPLTYNVPSYKRTKRINSMDKLRLLESTALTDWGTLGQLDTKTDPEFDDFVLISDFLPPRPTNNTDLIHYEKSLLNG